ncbi:hypothetical protein HPP92_018469 [Vanilla planifolia]|uniref:Exocyst subunit Exo70 family protein n=1 Tax=Vanilla planifolia TaxID=51239 RepID=A0A835QE63_VANPL|nr:hypothetical protein HPP92_018469 [Vanilla planifolia]
MAKIAMARFFAFVSFFRNSTAGDERTSKEHRLSTRLIDESIAAAEAMITKWHPASSDYAKVSSIFSHGRAEVSLFFEAISKLRQVMLFYSSPDCPESPSYRKKSIVRAQTLMQSAMRRLESEFHQILSSKLIRLDSNGSQSSSLWPYSSDEETPISSDSVHSYSADCTADLRSIADTMITNGYAREVVRVYKFLRRSVIVESLFHLGFNLSLPISNLRKLDWSVLDVRIESWISAARSAISTIFSFENHFCRLIFGGADDDFLNLVESCFADVTRDAALQFLTFPESVAKTKFSPEKLFRILDFYKTLSAIFPQIELIFSNPSTLSVRSKAIDSLHALAAAARDAIAEFELAVHKETSKVAVPGAGVHSLTKYAMNYLSRLSEYVPELADIYSRVPFRPPEPLPETSAPCSSIIVSAAVAERVAWLVFVLLCKLDHKAEFYKDVSLSYLFLANNVKYVVTKVRASGLIMVLGERWAERHDATARRHAESYVRIGWSKVAAVAENDGEWAAFEMAFNETAKAEKGRVVVDAVMREEVRVAVEGMILLSYRGLYESVKAAYGPSTAEMWSPEVITIRLEFRLLEQP